uniref:U-box domain-containing protein n=1 Tax=Kalanchoe fedtschenkoi TaxID=63787 RepID=A0A7N0UY61_KALFE
MEGDDVQSVEIPPYFLCPISLQIMKDPVTAVTGITYDRESIQKWLLNSRDATCPVTNQPLSRYSDLIPNHTLRRLIQAWCTTSSVDRIPTPTPVLDKPQLLRLIRSLKNGDVEKAAFAAGLASLEVLGNGVEMNRVLMGKSDVPKLMLELLVKCSTKCLIQCVQKCLAVFNLVWSFYWPTQDFEMYIKENSVELVDHLSAAALSDGDLSGHALQALKRVLEATCLNKLQLLKVDFISKMVMLLNRNSSRTQQPTTSIISVLQILIYLSSVGRNRTKITEAGAVRALIELELSKPPTHKRTTDLIFGLLSLLCHYVEGREKFLSHPCALALLAERLLRVSPAVDDQILEIISLVSKLSGRKEVVAEMLSVGMVSKLCMAMQANCADYVKAKARRVLRRHWSVWDGSPCVPLYLNTIHHR